ncbi:MAG: response regulator [Methylomonas sp.]|nr:response regulator [Methylomonas sp.]
MSDKLKFVVSLHVAKVDDATQQHVESLSNVLDECLGHDTWRLSTSKHVLVIDDEASVRDAFELALSPVGYQVECVADGQAGVEAAGRYRPDMVFLDLKMPGIDGLETLRRLQDRYESLPPVCIITSFAEDYAESLQRARSENLMFQLAVKPLSTAQIRRLTRTAVGVHA